MPLRLTPQDPEFFERYARLAGLIVEGADELIALLGAEKSERKAIASRMHDIESSADEVTRELIRKVAGSFVTPFDRSDMHSLAVALDNIVDLIDDAVDLIVLYQVDTVHPRVAKQVDLVARMAALTSDAMPRLRSMKGLSAYWTEITRLEKRANKQYRRMVADLFSTTTDPIEILKHKDIVEALESAANAFEGVALKIEAITVREA